MREYKEAVERLTNSGHPGVLGQPPTCQWMGGYLEGGSGNRSTYTFSFHESGELYGTGMDTDGQSRIEGRWSGVGNVIFWMEHALVGRMKTFCSGGYERSPEGNFMLKGSFISTTGVSGQFMASSPYPTGPPLYQQPPAINQYPAGLAIPPPWGHNVTPQ